MTELKDLKGISLFNDFTDEELKEFAIHAIKRTYLPGEVVITESEVDRILFVVKRGLMQVSRHAKDQEDQVLCMMSEGEFFGEMSFIDGKPHSATIKAVKESDLYLLNEEDYHKLLEINPKAGFKLLKNLIVHLSTIIRNMNKKYIDMVDYMWRWR